MRRVKLRGGWPQSAGALLISMAVAGVIAVPTWSQSQTAGRLAIGGVVLFAIALILGSGRLVAVTSVLILGAALGSLLGQENPAWIRGMVVGVLWYVAAELAWDGFERRDGIRRTSSYNARLIDEKSKVVVVSLLVSGLAIAISGAAPVRTILILAIVMIGIATALATTAGKVRRSRTDEVGTGELVSE